jgi:hypothetical protein
MTPKCKDFQAVTDKRTGNTIGTETAILMFVKSPLGLHPMRIGSAATEPGHSSWPQTRVRVTCRGEVESVNPRPNVTAANKELRQ